MVSFTDPQTAVTQPTKDALVAAFEDAPVDGVSVGFSASIATEVPNVVGPKELAGLVLAAIVLFALLGTLVAAGLPILTALIGVGIATLGALSLSSVFEMTSVTPVLGIMLGLAVGIDYALFIVNRHRRQLREGYSVEESIALANGTSGNAVVFAGSTVIIALVALNVTGIPFLGLMGSIGAASVAIAVLIAVTLTPALLSFAGMRVMRRKEKARIETGVHATPPTAEPLPTWRALGQVVVGIAVLLLIALPAASMRLGLPDGSTEPTHSSQYRAYMTVADKFGEGQNGTILVIADLPPGTTDGELLDHQVQVAKALSALDSVSAVAPVLTSDDHTIVGFQVVPTEGPTSVSTEQLVTDIRAASPLPGGITLGVAGLTSAGIDISQKLADALPVYLAVVMGLSLVIMVLVFRSLLVPLVATGGFALSLFAALGGTVAIYQWGWLGGVSGVSNPGPILNFLPTMLAGILFGLAMDYTLFLASGMREAYAHGAPSRTAVVLGFKSGRAVVSAAAIIMVSVFGGFVFSESAMIRPIGFALAFGVLLDAFVVRMVILPGLMHLLGDRAWWLPGWLDRIIPNVDVEGAALERKHPHVAGVPLEGPHGDPAPGKPAAGTGRLTHLEVRVRPLLGKVTPMRSGLLSAQSDAPEIGGMFTFRPQSDNRLFPQVGTLCQKARAPVGCAGCPEEGDSMAVLTRAIEADVPIQFADQEWTEYMFRSLYGSYAKGFEDVAASLSEIDADSGSVTFETEGDRLVKVSVEIEYTPPRRADATAEIAAAQARLERDLEKFRVFLLRRCEQESCRAA